MFTLAEIAELKNAGYTVSEILAFNAESQETPAQEPPKQEAPAQEPPKQEAPAQEPPKQETPKQETDPLAVMMGKIDEMISEIKRSNIRNMTTEIPNPENVVDTALANIINPPRKTNSRQ